MTIVMTVANKELYESPETKVVELHYEGIVCQSGGLRNYDRKDYEEWE